MLDLINIKTRYFEVKLTDEDGNELTLHLKACKLKVLNKLIKVAKRFDGASDEESMDILEDLEDVVALMLSNNKEGRRFTADDIQGLTSDQMITLISEYFSWLGNQKKSKI